MSVTDKELEKLEVQDEMESHKMSIAQKKAIVREMKSKYGRDWKKILKVVSVNRENLMDLYAVDPSLKGLNRPGGYRR